MKGGCSCGERCVTKAVEGRAMEAEGGVEGCNASTTFGGAFRMSASRLFIYLLLARSLSCVTDDKPMTDGCVGLSCTLASTA